MKLRVKQATKRKNKPIKRKKNRVARSPQDNKLKRRKFLKEQIQIF